MDRPGLTWLCSLAMLVAACSGKSKDPNLADASHPVGDRDDEEEASADDPPDAEADGDRSDADTTDAASDAGTSEPVDVDLDAASDPGGDGAARDLDAEVSTGGGGDAGASDDARVTSDASGSVGEPSVADAGDGGGGAACDRAGLTLPAGFCATVFAEGLTAPRHIAVTPAGDVYVANGPKMGASPSFVALRDEDGDGRADVRTSVGDKPGNGIAWAADYLYFAANDSILRFALPSGTLTPSEDPVVLVRDLPAEPDHPAKSVVVQGTLLYVNIGSASNSCQVQNRALESPGVDPCPDLERRGGIWKFDTNVPEQTQDGAVRFATGTRNANALAYHPQAGLIAAQNNRDQLHENWPQLFTPEDDARLPAEGILQLDLKDDYGWPYCYYDAEARKYFLAPEYGGDGAIEGRCTGLRSPLATLPAHWAPLGMAFYEHTQFPAHYRGGAFIANHGSRFAPNASEPLPGYNVVFVPFSADGRTAGPYERFAEGFAGPGRPLPDNARHRPVGVAVGPDGALFISDDQGGVVWKVVYRGL